jgi:hypothetical protein
MTNPYPALREARRALLIIGALAALIAPAKADPAIPAISNVPQLSLNQTLDSFHPSVKQTIALRDFLGSLRDKPVALGPQPNGLYLFDLRDPKNMRTGQIMVGADQNEGSIFIARLSGPATFDVTRHTNPPRVLDPKMRGAIHNLLAAAQNGPVFDTAVTAQHDLFMRDRPMLALTPLPTAYPDRIIESEASFFPDGSGMLRGLRAPVGVANPAMAAIHVSAKYYPVMTGDGEKAYRDTVLGVDADFTMTLADLGNKIACPVTGCAAPVAPVINGQVHLTRWPHAIVPSAPANLIAQISPPPPPLPDILQNPGAIDASGTPQQTN